MNGRETATEAQAKEPEVRPADEAASQFEDESVQEPSFFADPKRLVQTGALVVLLVVAIYVLLPSIVGLDDAVATLGGANPVWIAVGFGFTTLMFFSYVALFRGVIGEDTRLNWRESYEITMAGLAATRLFSAGGAGGIVLTYWALRKAGMPRRESAHRMTAFLVLLYAVYLLTLVIDGILLRTGVFPGPNPAGLTIVPAAIAGTIIVLLLGMALLPDDFERRIAALARGRRGGRFLRRLGAVPATVATGTRTAIDFVRNPSRGGLAVIGAIGFWAANIGILWASFHAFDVQVPLAVVVQGFFVGMVANLVPFAPGGVGAVDAGMIGTFVLFGLPGAAVFAAVLTYRLMAFWLPIPPGIVAFVQLQRTVERWKAEPAARASPAQPERPTSADTSESKV